MERQKDKWSKSQGQTLDRVDICLESEMQFGQLYAAISRCQSRESSKIFILINRGEKRKSQPKNYWKMQGITQ